MAIHAHSTRTPLLPQSGNPRPLLGQGFGKQPGPVTQAIRAMRKADPAERAIADLQDGLDRFFEGPAQFTHGIRALTRAEVGTLVEGLIDLLDAYDSDADHEPDVDREPDTDGEPSLCGLIVQWPGGGGDDREEDTADHEAGYQPLHMGGGGYAAGSFGRSA